MVCKGLRLGNNLPKQFVKLSRNKTILDFSIEAFKKNELIQEIIIVTNSNWVEKIKNKHNDCKVVKGGLYRSQSSFIGLKECHNNCKNVLIHDAARPFVSQKIINECINRLVKKLESDSTIASVQPKILNLKDKSSFDYAGACGGFIDFLVFPFTRGRIFNKIEKDNGQYDSPAKIFWASGAGFLTKKSIFDKISGFDDETTPTLVANMASNPNCISG